MYPIILLVYLIGIVPIAVLLGKDCSQTDALREGNHCNDEHVCCVYAGAGQ